MRHKSENKRKILWSTQQTQLRSFAVREAELALSLVSDEASIVPVERSLQVIYPVQDLLSPDPLLSFWPVSVAHVYQLRWSEERRLLKAELLAEEADLPISVIPFASSFSPRSALFPAELSTSALLVQAARQKEVSKFPFLLSFFSESGVTWPQIFSVLKLQQLLQAASRKSALGLSLFLLAAGIVTGGDAVLSHRLYPTLPPSNSPVLAAVPSVTVRSIPPTIPSLPVLSPVPDSAKLPKLADTPNSGFTSGSLSNVLYTVQPGDTLTKIAQTQQRKIETLLSANNLVDFDPALKVGSILIIPPTDGLYYFVRSGDTLLSVAAQFGVDPNVIKSYPANAISPLQSLDEPLPKDHSLIIIGGHLPLRNSLIWYQARPDDTLLALSGRFKISIDTIQEVNHLNLKPNEEIPAGLYLQMLPVSGRLYQAIGDDSIEALARRYGVSPASILDFAPNHLEATAKSLLPSEQIIIPYGFTPLQVDLHVIMTRQGDTPGTLALRFNRTPESIALSNGLNNVEQLLTSGQEIIIPPLGGISYIAQTGDNLDALADRFDVNADEILNYPANNLINTKGVLVPGQELFIPASNSNQQQIVGNPALTQPVVGLSQDPIALWNITQLSPGVDHFTVLTTTVAAGEGRYKYPGETLITEQHANGAIIVHVKVLTSALKPAGVSPIDPRQSISATGYFDWPTLGTISQFFGPTHNGLDIAANMGTPLVAADNGRVEFAGWNEQGLGLMVKIDHGNDFATVYGHMEESVVKPGQWVTKGQLLGYMGSTGHSTGAHIHFMIMRHGEALNPLPYMPGHANDTRTEPAHLTPLDTPTPTLTPLVPAQPITPTVTLSPNVTPRITVQASPTPSAVIPKTTVQVSPTTSSGTPLPISPSATPIPSSSSTRTATPGVSVPPKPTSTPSPTQNNPANIPSATISPTPQAKK